jgi:Glycosyltransferase family 9 (heptosyltransferase)
MHLLETYALSTGSKIGKPFILKKFFPVSFDKYITIQNSSGMPSKCYDYFQEVINFISPILREHNIGIVQIGGKQDQPLQNTENLQGATNIHQTAHIISNAMLHLGNDSFAIHMANAFGVKTVGLYSITLPEIAGPYFDKSISICLYPDNEKPSFNPNESPKRINKIKPEEVVNSCLKLLFNKDSEACKIQTLYIGNRYKETIIEAIPDSIVHPEFFKDAVLNLRCDYVDNIDLALLYNNIATRTCCVVTDKPFDLTPIPQIKSNLNLIIYDITKQLDINFVKALDKTGVRYVCASNKNKDTEENLNIKKTLLIDFCGVEEFSLIPENFDQNILNTQGLRYVSNRVLICNGKVFSSSAAYFENLNSENPSDLSLSLDKINNKNRFLEDLDYCMIYKD